MGSESLRGLSSTQARGSFFPEVSIAFVVILEGARARKRPLRDALKTKTHPGSEEVILGHQATAGSSWLQALGPGSRCFVAGTW